jgi:hypothetical protein
LQRIAGGRDTTATARDRISAIKELRSIDSEPGPPTIVQFNVPRDWMPPRMRDILCPEGSDGDGNATDARGAGGIAASEST